MSQWPRRVRAALLMGLTWALLWGPAAVLLSLFIDPDGSMDEMWIAVGAYPGFLGGVVFAAVLGFAARRRRLADLSMARAATWGALAGFLVGLLPLSIAESTNGRPLWLLGIVVVSVITLLSAISAAGSLALARWAERREAAGAQPNRAGAGS